MGGIRFFFFLWSALSLSHGATSIADSTISRKRKRTSETPGDAPATVTAWQQLTAGSVRRGPLQTHTNNFTDILWHTAPAKSPKYWTSKQNTVRQLNYNGDLCLPGEDFDNSSSRSNFLSVCRICSGLSLPVSSIPRSILCIHTLPPLSLPSVLLNLNQMLHHWRDRKEANVGKEARHYIFLFICQWSFSSFSLSLNRTACDILFKMIYIYIFLNGMKTN